MAEDAAARENRSMTASRKEEELADIEAKTKELTGWISNTLKIKLSKPNNFRESLLDGVVLCQIANSLKPNSVKKYHKKPRMLMMKMENIAFFLTAAKSRFNVPQATLFAPTDVHDDSDPASLGKVLNVLLYIKEETKNVTPVVGGGGADDGDDGEEAAPPAKVDNSAAEKAAAEKKAADAKASADKAAADKAAAEKTAAANKAAADKAAADKAAADKAAADKASADKAAADKAAADKA